MNTKLSAQLFGIGLLLSATACGSRTSLMQDDAGVDAGEQTSSVSTSSSSGGRSGTTTTRPTGAAGRTGVGAAGRPGRGGAAGAAGAPTGGKGGEGGKPAAEGGKGGEKAPEEGGQGGMGGEKAPEGGQGGQGGEGGAGGEGMAGAGGEGTAGAGGMAAAGSGGTTGQALTMLSTEQKMAVCGRITDGTSALPVSNAVRGYCASLGLRQPEMCTEIRDMCFDGPPVLPVCMDSVPDCPNINEDEFVACRVDQIKKFVEYNEVIECENPNSIPAGSGEPAGCVGPYERCPQLRDLAR